MAHNDYYVVRRDNDGWAVERPKGRPGQWFVREEMASDKAGTELAEHGVVHVQNEKGRFVRCNCPQCWRA